MNALVAQLDRATGYEPVGQEFESLRAHHKNQALTVINRKGFFVLSISLPILSPLSSDMKGIPVNRSTPKRLYTKDGGKALSARKSMLINAQNARACAVCPVAALVLHHLVVVALHAGYANAVLVSDIFAGNSFVVGLKNVALEQLCCSAPHFYACKSGIKISTAFFASVFVAANQQA